MKKSISLCFILAVAFAVNVQNIFAEDSATLDTSVKAEARTKAQVDLKIKREKAQLHSPIIYFLLGGTTLQKDTFLMADAQS